MAKKRTRYTACDGKMVLTLNPAEEGGFIVTSPLDPELMTQAETLEEAFEMAYDAAKLLKGARRAPRRPKKAPRATTKRRPVAGGSSPR